MVSKLEIKTRNQNDTVVKVHFPNEISVELVQANELRHYEIFSWSASLIATIAAGFWTAYFTTPRSWQLFWTSAAFSVVFVASFCVAIYYRRKVYHGSHIRKANLSDFKMEV